ncbi:SUMO protein smt3 [Trebouxia sp. C0010 RCD-2024]
MAPEGATSPDGPAASISEDVKPDLDQIAGASCGADQMEGQRVKPFHTPAHHHLNDGDEVEAILEMVGGQ